MNPGIPLYWLSRLLSLVTFWAQTHCLLTTSCYNPHVAEVDDCLLAAEGGLQDFGKRPLIADRSGFLDTTIPTMRSAGYQKFSCPARVCPWGRTEMGPNAALHPEYDCRTPYELPSSPVTSHVRWELPYEEGEMSVPVLVPLTDPAPAYAAPNLPMIYVMPGVLVGTYETLLQYFNNLAMTFPSSNNFFHHMYPADWFQDVEHQAPAFYHSESNPWWSEPAASPIPEDHLGNVEWSTEFFPSRNGNSPYHTPQTGPSNSLQREPKRQSILNNPDLMERMVKAPHFIPGQHGLTLAQDAMPGDLRQHGCLRTPDDHRSTVYFKNSFYTEPENKRTLRPDAGLPIIAEQWGQSRAQPSSLMGDRAHSSHGLFNKEHSLASRLSEAHEFITAGGRLDLQLAGKWNDHAHPTHHAHPEENFTSARQTAQASATAYNKVSQTDKRSRNRSPHQGIGKSKDTSHQDTKRTEGEDESLPLRLPTVSKNYDVVSPTLLEPKYLHKAQGIRERSSGDPVTRKQPSQKASHMLNDPSKTESEKFPLSSPQKTHETVVEKKTKNLVATLEFPADMDEQEIESPLHENKDRSNSSKNKPGIQLPISLQEAFGTVDDTKTKTPVANLAFPIETNEQERKFLLQDHRSRTVIDGQRIKLNYKMTRFLMIHLQLHDPTPHRGLKNFMQPLAYASFKTLWFINRAQITNAEDWLKAETNLGLLEGTRRTLAFRRQIQQHTIAGSWKTNKKIWLEQEDIPESEVMAFEKHYGLSEDPSILPELRAQPFEWDMNSKLGRSQQTVSDMLHSILGDRETNARTQIMYYLMKRVNPHPWWEKNDLEHASMLHGLDLLNVLKVGDALQFGSEFVFEKGPGRMSVDSAFKQLLSFMIDTHSALPWVESSERQWLACTYGHLYQKRIQALSQLILSTNSTKEQGLQVLSSVLKERMDERLIQMDSKIMGDILQWCDAGIGPEKWLAIASKYPHVTKYSQWKIFLPKEMSRLSAKQESIFRAWFRWRKGLNRKSSGEVKSYYDLFCQWRDWIRTGFWAVLRGKVKGGGSVTPKFNLGNCRVRIQ